MDLTELGWQYLKTATALSERIRALNKKLKTVSAEDLSVSERIVIRRRITALCHDVTECRKYAKSLIEYSKKESNNEQSHL